MDLGAALTDLIRAYCREEGIAWKDEGAPFVKQLQREAMLNMDDPIAERRIFFRKYRPSIPTANAERSVPM